MKIYSSISMNKFFRIFFLATFFFLPAFSHAASPAISVFPASVIQGEPVEIIVQNATTSQVKSISFAGKTLGLFSYENTPTAFAGIDINQKPGIYQIFVTLSDGSVLKNIMTVGERKKVSLAFDIPAELGGNSTSSQTTFINTLAGDNQILLGLKTNPKSLWTKPFVFPLTQIAVTDPYGYSRQTGGISVIHKGTDFRANIGTPVMAMNRGVVRLAKQFIDYGNTIVIDHGLGIMTFYMHLSKINVSPGQLISQGQVIGLSGATGDALAPHLHVSVRINNISIDPMKFMALFK